MVHIVWEQRLRCSKWCRELKSFCTIYNFHKQLIQKSVMGIFTLRCVPLIKFSWYIIICINFFTNGRILFTKNQKQKKKRRAQEPECWFKQNDIRKKLSILEWFSSFFLLLSSWSCSSSWSSFSFLSHTLTSEAMP